MPTCLALVLSVRFLDGTLVLLRTHTHMQSAKVPLALMIRWCCHDVSISTRKPELIRLGYHRPSLTASSAVKVTANLGVERAFWRVRWPRPWYRCPCIARHSPELTHSSCLWACWSRARGTDRAWNAPLSGSAVLRLFCSASAFFLRAFLGLRLNQVVP